jgi:hypothetical protein
MPSASFALEVILFWTNICFLLLCTYKVYRSIWRWPYVTTETKDRLFSARMVQISGGLIITYVSFIWQYTNFLNCMVDFFTAYAFAQHSIYCSYLIVSTNLEANENGLTVIFVLKINYPY